MTPSKPTNPEEGVRLNRFLARAGFGSRRGVEELILAGRVSVDGKKVTDLGRRVDPETDVVTVDGQPARTPIDVRVYAFHKPLNVVSTMRAQGDQVGLDEFRRRGSIPDRFNPVGRLDQDSSGLLLWTDDGVLAQALMRPDSAVWKAYVVTLARRLSRTAEKSLADGSLELDGRPVRRCRLHRDPDGDPRRWVFELHEGRKRQIRRMVAAVDNRVVALKRVAVGPIALGLLRAGDFRRLTRDEETALRQAAEPANER